MPDAAIDKVRASRDGHQYHEAWLARRALGLLLPRDELCGIAVEGLSEEDQKGASAATTEIADATFYFGAAPNFRQASRVEIAQFKYSIAKSEAPFVCADAKKTLQKFAATEADPEKKKILRNICYSIYTNRPIAQEFSEAITCLTRGIAPSDKLARSQYQQLIDVIPLNPKQRKKFASKISFIGKSGDLQSIERGNARIIADWSASHDVLARARLGDLRQLARNKAGFTSQNDKVIFKVDVLAALDIAHEDDLLPTRQAFAHPGAIVEREQLQGFIDGLGNTGCWIVHAAGGIGKTVFAQSIASRLPQDEVVLFDCFGGGAYRSPSDGRHRPERGLMHIVNELACRGLCDPILPGASDAGEVVRRSIRRFSQVIAVLRRTRSAARLLIVVDAADNAATEAKDRGQPSFPQLLLESLSFASPIDGLICIATARTERRDLAVGKACCKDFQLQPFSLNESTAFIIERRPDATRAQIGAIYRRADGNPRVIANLIEPDRSLADLSPGKVELRELIKERIERAVQLAGEKGAKSEDVAAFLCALSVLPPPVPVTEMAAAFGIMSSEIESFAADLAPLLERTRHGLIFRDEPTETLVREIYGQKLSLLDGVVKRLTDAQASSVYAARSLPGLLFLMGRTDLLRSLAFDARFPPELDSDVGKRTIRLNRLRTAVGAAAKARDFGATVDLLLELTSLAIVDERGEDYLLANPDLVMGLGDPEALRRLFEVRTSWPGTRHARLATAYISDSDTAEAYGHVKRAEEWLSWHEKQDENTRREIKLRPQDYASISFYLLATGRAADAAEYLSSFSPFYEYLVASRMFEYCASAEAFGKLPHFSKQVRRMLGATAASPALIAALLSARPGLSPGPATTSMLKKLARQLEHAEELREQFPSPCRSDSYRHALLRCAMRMAHLRLATESNLTLVRISPTRYGIWALHSSWDSHDVIPWILSMATHGANDGRAPDLFDCLPQELWALVEDAPRPESDEAQYDLLKARLRELEQRDTTAEIEERRKKSKLSRSEQYRAAVHVNDAVMPILALTRRLVSIVQPKNAFQRSKAITDFFDEWKSEQTKERDFSSRERLSFINALYKACVAEAFTALDLFVPDAAKRLADCLGRSSSLTPETIIGFVRRLAQRTESHIYAGQFAVAAVKVIERENDIRHRTLLFARLARALVPANRTEASALFKRGLAEGDAIGSGDFEFSTELLHFARTLRSAHLQPALALRLAKICEMNVYDTDKWPWSLTAEAFARVSGFAYLAQIARWNDRSKVDLDLTLPPALTALVDSGLMPAGVALPLLRLVDPIPTWGWGWHDLIRAVLRQPDSSTESVEDLLDQFETAYPRGSHYFDEVWKSLETKPNVYEASKGRIERLQQRQKLPRKSKIRDGSPSPATSNFEHVRKHEADRQAQIETTLKDVNPTDGTSFEAVIEKLEGVRGWPDAKINAFAMLRARVAYADRAKHLDAIVGAQNLTLSEKNSLLQAARDDWAADSPTGLAYLSNAGIRLVKEHAEELLGNAWGFTSDLFKLAELSSTPQTDLAINLVEAVTTRDLNASANDWLTLATMLSEKADADTPRVALERLLDSGAARLADDVGDGPWRAELDPGTDAESVAAGLLWFSLGSPRANARWRAAHVVRALARFGRWRVIELLMDRLDATDAGAFQDRQLPFFHLNAQLWLLLAIARVAVDHPKEIEQFRPRLAAIVFNDSFPHIGIREAARDALLHTIVAKRDTAAKTLRARLKFVNKSKFPRLKERLKTEPDFPWQRPEEVPKPEPRFYFDYDFEKYSISQLADVFGLPQWRISDLTQRWIVNWAPSVTNMHELSGREAPYRRDRPYRATDDSYHSHGSYLAWHALAVESQQVVIGAIESADGCVRF